MSTWKKRCDYISQVSSKNRTVAPCLEIKCEHRLTYHFQHTLLVIGNLSYSSRCFAFGVNASDIKPISKKHIKLLQLPHKAIPIKCFVSHRPPSCEGGSVSWAKKKME